MSFAKADSGSGTAATACTVPLSDGWDGPPPVAGDVVMLEVVRPEGGVSGPAGWNHDGGRTWWKQIGPHDHFATFTASGTPGKALEWEIRKLYVTPPFVPFDDAGTGESAVNGGGHDG